MSEKDLGGTTLRCITPVHPRPPNANAAPPPASSVYCFDPGKSILRFASDGDYQTVYDDPVDFQEHSLARDIRVTRQGKRFLNIHLETAEALTEINESDFTPAPDGIKQPPRRIVISSQVMQGNLIEKVAPIYPENAKQNRIQGIVVLQATIGEHGHVQDVRVISSPVKDFSNPAMEAVRQWVYKPFLLNGEPVEVQTTVNVVFSLGR